MITFSLNQLRWTGFGLLCSAYMLVFFHRMAPAVVSSDLMATFSISGAAMGSLAAMYYYIYTALQIPSGILSDTLGPRYSVGISGLIAAAGSIVFGLAPDFTTASIGRFMVGLGVSFVFVGLMKYNTLWFPERRYGAISGLTLLLGNLGAISAAGPLAWSLGWLDWREVFVLLGIGGGIISLAILLLLRNAPEQTGQLTPPASLLTKSGKVVKHHWLRELKVVLLNGRIWPGFITMFGTTGAIFAFAGLWGVPLVRDVFELSRNEAANYTTAMLVGLATGSIFVGLLSDHIGKRKPPLIAFSALALMGWLGLLLLPWQPGYQGLLLYFLIGLAAGGVSIIYAATKEVAAPLYAGMAIALVNSGLFLGAAVVQPLYGWILDLTWDGTLLEGVRIYRWADYENALWLCVGLSLLGFIATFFATETGCRNIYTSHREESPPELG